MGRGGGGAAGRTVKTKIIHNSVRIIHNSVRRPAHRTLRPQNLHSDPDLQIKQPCGVRERGGAVEVLLGAPRKRELFTPVCAGPPSAPPAPKIRTVTQTFKSGSPVVSGNGERQGVVLLGAPRNENLES